jgi:hypothetical protein
MNKPKRLTTIIALTGAALAIVGAGTAIATQSSAFGTSVTRVTILTEDAASAQTATTFTTVGSTTIFAPAGSQVLGRFSAESACFGGTGWCSARILLDGAEATPVVGTDFAFDSTNNNAETSSSWESHSFERTATSTFTGNHTVAIQVAMVGTGVQQRLDDWTLSAWAIAQ